MDWSQAAQVATSIGAIIAAISLAIGVTSFAIGYRRYNLEKRHAYVSGVREVIYSSSVAFERLKGLLNYDLAYEMASSVAYSDYLSPALDEIYKRFFQAGDGGGSETELQEYLAEELPFIVVSIHTPLVELYENLVFGTAVDIGKYRADHPSLVRVLLSVNSIFQRIEDTYRQIVRDKDLWRSAIRKAYAARTTIGSPQELKNRLVLRFVTTIESERRERLQADINDIQETARMVTDSYLALRDEEIDSLRKKEKQENYISMQYTEHYTQDMEEAEKGLKYILSSHELVKYHDLIRNVYQRYRG